jgi:hypothetical protein
MHAFSAWWRTFPHHKKLRVDEAEALSTLPSEFDRFSYSRRVRLSHIASHPPYRIRPRHKSALATSSVRVVVYMQAQPRVVALLVTGNAAVIEAEA